MKLYPKYNFSLLIGFFSIMWYALLGSEVIPLTQGKRVREVRKSLQLTLEEFGKKLGVQRAIISKIEIGDRTLTNRMIKDICRVYHVSYDWLVYGEGEQFEDLTEAILDELCIEYNCDSTDKKLISEYLKLDPESRQTLKDYMRKVFVEESEDQD